MRVELGQKKGGELKVADAACKGFRARLKEGAGGGAQEEELGVGFP